MKFLLTAALSLSVCSPALVGAAEGQSTNLFNAGASCLPALPRYDGNVRKRPLAVVNEGTTSSFLTCNYTVDEYASDAHGGVERFDLTAKNQGNSASTVTCTAVIGVDDGQARYIIKSATLQPGERKKMEWKATDYSLPNGWEGPVNMSCLLPPNMGLNEGHVHWDYEDQT